MEVAPLAKGLAGAGPVEEEEEVVGLAGAASGGAGAGQQDGAVQDASLQLRLGRPPRRWQAPPGRSNTPESGSFPRAWSPAAATWES
ncbi:hypothetical protein OGAPHI_005776 [Ogataea philodendri]|uniref:Uncharacterized protein n=1 Tax=Ogataea philodendri TaxID=1378263 RepID=A0A9P8T1U9_9ASCO|nr:uncharacterized protein OGAPHI_005776 [Ogataea philodendri]KAH3662524.1 hypothetical protein OGAPHI_005776 [Ogataea philodendri]